ncbi:MAG: carboxypeptidase-like regulatory domain-containing protein [Bryobacterales bacterium]|nr:carboxypeptidase-like regulatory domain-containing protein [Bryobacterales bacterium]
MRSKPVLSVVVCCAAILLSGACLQAQNISGSIKGAVADPTGAAVPSADVTLTGAATGSVAKTTSNASGLFAFPSVLAGRYTLTIQARGFQQYERTGIELTASEIRDLGSMPLSIGELRATVSVVDTPVTLQVASGEKAGAISATQLNQIALKGRDFMSLLSLMPGIVDDGSQARDTASRSAFGGVFVNGGRSDMKNFTVDGVTDMDTGSNGSLHYEPNMDSIAEVKVLVSNYQAEYGRSSSGLISVITKGGTQQFHGSGWWSHRHEQFNANTFFRNRVGLDRVPYRYNIAGFSIGGPAYIPNKFNKDKSKLFFFASQEYTRQRADAGNQFRNMPTELERNGDFSRSFDTSGKLIPVTDSTTGRVFPGNIIPANRINKLGQGILKFFPLPNYIDPDPTLVYRQNYKSAASGADPRRNDMIRLDLYASSKLNGYFRWIRDADVISEPYQGFNFAYTTTLHHVPGHGYAGHITYTMSPTLLSEFTLGKSWNSSRWELETPDATMRTLMGNIPQWFPNQASSGTESEAIDAKMFPNVAFGGTPVNAPSVSINNIQHQNHNDTWDITYNLNWIAGRHNIKTGVYVNLTDKVQVSGNVWNGAFNFGVNKNNPYDSGNGYANALLGVINTYSESGKDIFFDAKYWTTEFFIQDNWRVNSRLTVDYGVRFYHLNPQVGLDKSFSAFDPATYDPKKTPLLYSPGLDAAKKRVAVDPRTGATTYEALIGKYVSGTGDYANGMRVGGVDGYRWGLYGVRPISATPRLGFAWDVFGKGRTVIRGGAGIFLDRSRQLLNSGTANNPPVDYAPTLYYGDLNTFANSSGAIGPTTSSFVFPAERVKLPSVASFSFGVQQQLPSATLLDVSYVGSASSHLLQSRNLNPIPMFSRFDPKNADPTLVGKPLPDDFLRPYRGLGALNANEFAASANYHSLQTRIERRFTRGFGFGVAYTWSKSLGVASTYNESSTSYFDFRKWEYGPLSFDRSHVFTLNYIWEIPKLGQRLKNKVIGAVTDNWAVTGVTRFQSGAPFMPGFSTTYTSDITGSGEGARITVIGKAPLGKGEKTFYRNFNTAAFALTPVGSFGNAGVGILRGPGSNNWDVSLRKNIPIGLGENRSLQFRTEFYNAFNHTQFSGLDSAARFDATGAQVNANLGAFTSARSGRVISFTLRLHF